MTTSPSDEEDVVIFRVDGETWEFPLSLFLQQKKPPLLQRIVNRWKTEYEVNLEDQVFRVLRSNSAKELISHSLFSILGQVEWKPREEDLEDPLQAYTIVDIFFSEDTDVLSVQLAVGGMYEQLISFTEFLTTFIPQTNINLPFLHS